MTDTALQPGYRTAPFDALAETYDETFTTSRIGRAQRDAVHQELDRAFHGGHRILEINCGTGVDAVHLAERGAQVLACDSAAGMIEVARRRADRSELETRIGFCVLESENLGALVETEGVARFDGALSNFAGLNCVEDLEKVAGDLARLLKPGAPAVLCFLGRSCGWEILWYLGHGNAGKAFRRCRSEGSLAQLAKGVTIRVRYPGVRQVTRAFAPYFRLTRWKGVGVAVPPSYLEPWARRFPRILRLLATADRWLGRCPVIRAMADHILLIFERTQA